MAEQEKIRLITILNYKTMNPQAYYLLKEESLAAKRYFLNIRQTRRGERYNKKHFEFTL